MIRSSSIQSYRELHRKHLIGQMQFDVIDCILKLGNKPMTRREIEISVNLRGSNICGRVNELINKDSNGENRYVKDGEGIKRLNVLFDPDEVILLEAEKRFCKVSNSKIEVVPVYCNLGKNQGELFDE